MSSKVETPTPKANIGLRPYFAETDKKFVHYLFYSTYFNMVPKAVRVRLLSFYIVPIWILLYALLILYIPTMVSNFGWSSQLLLAIQVLMTLVVFLGGLLILFWYTDKYDLTQRVLQGIENDLKEPDQYYRGTTDRPRKGNFWVLTLNEEIVGCIGLDQTLVPVMDQSESYIPYVRASERPRAVDAKEIHEAEWKRTAYWMAKADDFIRLVLVGALDILTDIIYKIKGTSQSQIDKERALKKTKVLFEPHRSNEASVRRLAIKLECQGHGLSTVLLKRVAFWAHANQIEYLYADTNELQTEMAEILVKRHGYKHVSTKKLGYFHSQSTFKLDVKLWMSQELERRAQEKRKEDQLKEDEELKEYE